jgi:hypothetical protein
MSASHSSALPGVLGGGQRPVRVPRPQTGRAHPR